MSDTFNLPVVEYNKFRHLAEKLLEREITAKEQFHAIKMLGGAYTNPEVIESGGIVAGFYEEKLLNNPNATLMTKNYYRMSFDEAISFLNEMCNSLYCHSDRTLYIDQITDVILNSWPNYSIKELRNSEDTLDTFIHNAYHKIKQDKTR